MNISELTTLPVRAGAALRGKRLFHPSGILCGGTVTRLAPDGHGLPLVSGEVIGRISKGAGTPGSLPDFAGLAWRMPGDADGPRPWDVLAVSSAARVALRPVRSWPEAQYSTLMPLRYRGGLYWLRARMRTPVDGDGLSVQSVRDRLGSDTIEFTIEQACRTGPFTELATLTFDRPLCDDDPGCDQPFDPTVRSGTELTLAPRWLTRVRGAAYRNSREGRGAE
ncbi:phosphodiesterase [Mycolicibacterium austroafricanum]|uniref:phosphodiesterase n=1 Tax=Mycolicibacterium austroafricanum TaxID=39687 RepID=UPI001CA36CBB|nr:phosphodiesterase [Mycolicibacterium austroafricanum]QZT63000.1 phosphodiesterase [Mycolicibacterium austroafricanum]